MAWKTKIWTLLFVAAPACGGSEAAIAPVEQIIELRPPRVIFAAVPVQSTSTSSITIKNAGDASLDLVGVIVDGEAGPFSFRVVEKTLEGVEETPLIVTFRPTAPGLFEERVEVRAAPLPLAPLVVPAEPVTLEVKGEAF